MRMNIIKVELVNTQDPTVLMISIIVAIILVGLILLIIGNSFNKFFSFPKEFYTLMKNKKMRRMFGLCLVLFGVMILFLESSQLREYLVALAVVFATVLAVVSLNETEKLRKENASLRMKEKLDKGLNEINGWLVQVVEHISILSRFIENKTDLKKTIMDCRADLTKDVASSINTLAISNELTSNPHMSDTDKGNLRIATTNVDNAVRDFNTLLFNLDLDTITEESSNNVINSAGDLASRIRQLLTITAHISFRSSL